MTSERDKTLRCLMLFVVAMAIVDVFSGWLIAKEYDTEAWGSVGTVITMTGVWLGIDKLRHGG